MWYAFSMNNDNRKKILKIVNCILIVGLTAGAVSSAVPEAMVAEATTISEVQENINKHQNELNNWNNQIADLEDEQDLIEEQIADLNAEIVNTMASIGLLEDEISQKENEIGEKQIQIEQTQAEYEAAVEREETQRQNMMDCTRMMYENNNISYITAILEGKGLADILNQMDYIERVYEYSMGRLDEFAETKNQVHDLWDRLEEEKAGLDRDKANLEADRTTMESLKADLDIKLAKKKKESANFEAEIKRAQQEAAVAKKLLQQDQAKLKQLQQAQNAANMAIQTTNYTATIDNAQGSELGKTIAKYACQFIGNPYVMGGTSLTNGADCSGFIYKIYQDFGYSIPRTSYLQRSAGTEVSYENAQPGDIICYDGHVGMYIGGGLIVHASSAKTGIKVSRAQYRTILSVRRII
ncbi:MAG: NlpC/P60 family protein [Lachnospiraceae bacterium]|nr:NlpC/P60 family protein [Lachnospiraceae bacterium]